MLKNTFGFYLPAVCGVESDMKKKICLVTSSGGHMFQLAQLASVLGDQNYFWVTFDRPDVKEYVKEQNVYFAYYPETRNIFNAVRNFFLAWQIVRKEKPDVMISCGAGIAVPFFIVAKVFRIHTVFIEPIDFIKEPSLTGKMVYQISNIFLVQLREQKRFFPQAQYWGGLL